MTINVFKVRRYKVPIICDNCGVTFLIYQFKLNRNKGVYCSKKCTYASVNRKHRIAVSNTGKKPSNETKRKISMAKIGRKLTPETILKIKNANSGTRSACWKGGRHKDSNGYVLLYSPKHPNKFGGNRVFEHRAIMEMHLGRTLSPIEVVHHINGVINDNRIENLMLFANNSEHLRFHWNADNYKNRKHNKGNRTSGTRGK
jgi:hypothetical protein